MKKHRTTSKTDPDSDCSNHGNKRGIGYLMQATVDCKHGVVTGVDVFAANEKESLLVLCHLERQTQWDPHTSYCAGSRLWYRRCSSWAGTAGYHRIYPLLSNSPEEYGFFYLPQEDAFCCPEGARLLYQRLNCSHATGKYLRCYQVQGDTCKHCICQASCFKQTGIRRRILRRSCYPAFYRGHQRVGSDAYWQMMRLWKIWAEGLFAALKREHCISKIEKEAFWQRQKNASCLP